MKNILVIGSSNVDYVIDVPYTPKVGETIMAENMLKMSGGKGANQAYACAKIGGNVTFLSAIGDDDPGKIILDNLKSVGINVANVQKVTECNSGIAIIYVNKEGNNCIVVIPGANEECNENFVKTHDAIIEASDILMIQAEIPLSGVYYAIQKAKSLGKTVIFNPAPAPDFIPDDVYDGIDFFTPNETELEKLTGITLNTIDKIETACKKLLHKNVKNVILTLGERGVMLCNNNICRIFPAFKVPVVDTTAAGDTFNGAFAVSLASGKSIEDSIVFANLASAISVSRKGAQASVPSMREIINFKKMEELL